LATLCSLVEHGKQLLTIAVMVILLTAPLGAIAIMVAGPRLLNKDTVEKVEEKEDA
jgi:multisubunit Na+/H+ antiporter MnhG subunit